MLKWRRSQTSPGVEFAASPLFGFCSYSSLYLAPFGLPPTTMLLREQLQAQGESFGAGLTLHGFLGVGWLPFNWSLRQLCLSSPLPCHARLTVVLAFLTRPQTNRSCFPTKVYAIRLQFTLPGCDRALFGWWSESTYSSQAPLFHRTTW